MNSRRDFFKQATAAGVLSSVNVSAAEALTHAQTSTGTGLDDRRYWLSILEGLATPVLGNLSKRNLKKAMPVETTGNAEERGKYTHLEAFGRLLAGMAPWLGAETADGSQASMQSKFVELARASLDAATDPGSPDFMNFTSGGQPLVDTAFLAQGILRAKSVLWTALDTRVKQQLVAALKSSRVLPTPTDSNWVLFPAMIEAALLEMGEATQQDRLEDCLRQMLGWYVGDGLYGDGPFFHFDYYNSFVIQPMLLDVLGVLRRKDERFAPAWNLVLERARRYAEIQERLIAPDGTFPAIGRSITYRFGALQMLAQISLARELPAHIRPAQVRGAMTAAIRRTMEAPGTFDANGWLQIGLCGRQPSLGEPYISTGSLYLCSAGLLPLGLPMTDEFWSGSPVGWTSQRIWSGEPLPADHAITDAKTVEIPTLKR
jgi:hypothetical protein